MNINDDALCTAIDAGNIVICDTQEQRNLVLSTLLNLGYGVGQASLEYLKPGASNTTFYHVGFTGRNHDLIACYADSIRGFKNTIPFADIIDIEGKDNDYKVSEEEFSEAIAVLFGIG